MNPSAIGITRWRFCCVNVGRGWCSAQRIKIQMIAGGNHTKFIAPAVQNRLGMRIGPRRIHTFCCSGGTKAPPYDLRGIGELTIDFPGEE